MNIIISFLHKIIPSSILKQYRYKKYLKYQEKDKSKTTEEVFTEIYANNRWGGSSSEFCSGGGSVETKIVTPYISVITENIHKEGLEGKTFVDLGCGDFRIGKQLIPLCSKYIGIDIVRSLIERNQKEYENDKVKFIHLNMINEELPDGDVCFIRQVLQHLSNQQIINVLKKLKKYKLVFITEHYPTDNNFIVPNIDKVQGMDIRIYENSGVYLSEQPFGIPKAQLFLILEVPNGTTQDIPVDRGIIRTFLYKPGDI